MILQYFGNKFVQNQKIGFWAQIFGNYSNIYIFVYLLKIYFVDAVLVNFVLDFEIKSHAGSPNLMYRIRVQPNFNVGIEIGVNLSSTIIRKQSISEPMLVSLFLYLPSETLYFFWWKTLHIRICNALIISCYNLFLPSNVYKFSSTFIDICESHDFYISPIF